DRRSTYPAWKPFVHGSRGIRWRRLPSLRRAMPKKPEPIDIFFEMPLNKWPMFDSKTLASSKVVLLQDLKPVVDMFNANGVGIGIRTASEVISELALNTHDRQRLVALMGARSFDVYS